MHAPDPRTEQAVIPLETKLWRLSMIIAAARRIHSSLTLDSVLDTFLEIAIGEVGAVGGSIYLRDAEGMLELVHSRWPAGFQAADHKLSRDHAIQAADQDEVIEETWLSELGAVVALPLRDESKSSIGILQIFRKSDSKLDASDQLFLTELTHFASLSIRNAQYHQDSLARAHLEGEIVVARDIQLRTLPEEMPTVPGYDVAGFSRPAEETSGDSFDFVPTEQEELVMLLADATGHGIGPALSVTQARSMLRMAIRLGADLQAILKNINDQLYDDLASNRFVTAFIGHLEPDTHRLSYHSPGQAPLILLRATTGEVEILEATCPPLGVLPMFMTLNPQVINLAPGDTLALITDGVFEAEDRDGNMLGTPAVAETLKTTTHLTCAEVVQEILEQVDNYQAGTAQQDDITIVLIRRNG